MQTTRSMAATAANRLEPPPTSLTAVGKRQDLINFCFHLTNIVMSKNIYTKIAQSAAAILMILFANNSNAWLAKSTISEYYIWSPGLAFIQLQGTFLNPDGCQNNAYYYALDTSQPNFKYLWATVLSAYNSGQTVSISLSGCTGGGTAGYPLVIGIASPAVP